MKAQRILNETPWSSYDAHGNELNNGSYRKVTVGFDDDTRHVFEVRSDGKETKVLGYNDIQLANETGAIQVLTGQWQQLLP